MLETQQAITEITGACGHVRRVVLSLEPQRALTEIEQLASSLCRPCQQATPSLRNLTWRDAR